MTIPLEVDQLCRAILRTPDGAVVEIGSDQGKTTLSLVEAAGRVGKHVYSIDPYPEDLEGKVEFYFKGCGKKHKQIFKERVLDVGYPNITQFNEYLEDCIHELPDELSVVFIDSLHEYDIVLKDFGLIYPKVVMNGEIYVHDISWQTGQLSKTIEGGVWRMKFYIERMQSANVYHFPNMIGVVK